MGFADVSDCCEPVVRSGICLDVVLDVCSGLVWVYVIVYLLFVVFCHSGFLLLWLGFLLVYYRFALTVWFGSLCVLHLGGFRVFHCCYVVEIEVWVVLVLLLRCYFARGGLLFYGLGCEV